MEAKEFAEGILAHFPKGSDEKLKGKKLHLGGGYCDVKTGVG